MQYLEGGAHLEGVQRTQGGKGELLLIVRGLRWGSLALCSWTGPKARERAASVPRKFSAIGGQEGIWERAVLAGVDITLVKMGPEVHLLEWRPGWEMGSVVVVEANRTVSAGGQLGSENFLGKTLEKRPEQRCVLGYKEAKCHRAGGSTGQLRAQVWKKNLNLKADSGCKPRATGRRLLSVQSHRDPGAWSHLSASVRPWIPSSREEGRGRPRSALRSEDTTPSSDSGFSAVP